MLILPVPDFLSPPQAMKNANTAKVKWVLTILKYYTSPRRSVVIFYSPHMQPLKVIEGSKFMEESTTQTLRETQRRKDNTDPCRQGVALQHDDLLIDPWVFRVYSSSKNSLEVFRVPS